MLEHQVQQCAEQTQLKRYTMLRDDAHCAFRDGRFDCASRLYYQAMQQSRVLVRKDLLTVVGMDAVLEAAANCYFYANHPDTASLTYQLKQSEQALLAIVLGDVPLTLRRYALGAYVDLLIRLSRHLARNDFSASSQAYLTHLRHLLAGPGKTLRVLH